MAIDVRMPKLSDNMEEGVIIRWMKAPGDEVAKGEALAEVETDKADVELEASESGVLREIKVAEGQSAAVGAVIATLAAPGETGGSAGEGIQPPRVARPRAARADERRPARTSEDGQADEEEDRRRRAAASAVLPARAAAAARRSRRRPAPRPTQRRPHRRVRAAATEERSRAEGLDRSRRRRGGTRLAAGVAAGRRGGREPLRRARQRSRWAHPQTRRRGIGARSGAELPRRVSPLPTPEEADADDDGRATARATIRARARRGPRARAEGGNRVVEASRMRLAIAKRMSEAKREIPHFYVGAEIDMTETMRLRESIKRAEAIAGLTVTHLLLRALAVALVRHPRINASGATARSSCTTTSTSASPSPIEDGLVVPVLHRAQTLTLAQIAEPRRRR